MRVKSKMEEIRVREPLGCTAETFLGKFKFSKIINPINRV